MPTITIESNVTDQAARQRFATRITVSFGKLGIDVGHILIKWRQLGLEDVFAGPLCLASSRRNMGRDSMFASVSIEIAHTRQRRWRLDLMEAVQAAAANIFGLDLLFIRLVPVDPADYRNPVFNPGARPQRKEAAYDR
jgi:hypothetical protein